MPFCKRSKRALERALKASFARGDSFIGAEHIVLGVLDEPESLAVQVLGRLGVPPERIREQLGVPSA
jgi:ATP-dependent Clp protease ATP-binding subunit ClpC